MFKYMQKALNLAITASHQDEIPVGCLIVDSNSGEIITSSHNLSQHTEDATAHAEILAIREACKKLNQNRLWDMDMYVTLEPCPMCAGAIINSRIKNVYFGATDEKNGAVVSAAQLFDMNFTHKPNYEGGILSEECSEILSNFFKELRKQKVGEEK